jgi:hypothetical protein
MRIKTSEKRTSTKDNGSGIKRIKEKLKERDEK